MHSGKQISHTTKSIAALVALLLMSTAGAAAWAADMSNAKATPVSAHDSFVKHYSYAANHAPNPGAGKTAKLNKVVACADPLARLLRTVGFRGDDLRQAWAIAMRESGGNPKLGPGHPSYNGEDVGLYQFNRPTFANEPWWDERKLLNARYNARLAFKYSEGGANWWMWGLDGDGNLDPGAYTAVWNAQKINDWILQPFLKYYAQYPCP